MVFAPVARWRNFKIIHIEEVLEAYKKVPKGASREKGEEIVERYISSYARTAYQIFCQMGLQNRGNPLFEVQEYVLDMEREELRMYMEFWFKTYYTPNSHVTSTENPCLVYYEAAKKILSSENKSINLIDFFETHNMNKSYLDILGGAFASYAKPIKYSNNMLSVNMEDVLFLSKEIQFIKKFAKIPSNHQEKNIFFNRFNRDRFDEYQTHNNFMFSLKIDALDKLNYDEISRETMEDYNVQNLKEKTDSELEIANNRQPKLAESKKTDIYITDSSIKKAVIRKANYKCELGEYLKQNHKSFINSKNQIYMEGHHIIPMAAQKEMININIDREENIISLCPICHRAIHYGNNNVKSEYIKNVFEIKKHGLDSSNIKLSLDDILKYYILNSPNT